MQCMEQGACCVLKVCSNHDLSKHDISKREEKMEKQGECPMTPVFRS